MLVESRREIDKSIRALVSAIIRQAYLDLEAMHTPKKNRKAGTGQIPDEATRKSAREFLASDDCFQCTLALGISPARHRELVERVC